MREKLFRQKVSLALFSKTLTKKEKMIVLPFEIPPHKVRRFSAAFSCHPELAEIRSEAEDQATHSGAWDLEKTAEKFDSLRGSG